MSDTSSLKASAAKYTFLVTFSVIVAKFLNIFLIKVFTNVVTPEQYGLYQFFVDTTIFISGLSTLGLISGMFRYIVKYDVDGMKQEEKNVLVSTWILIFLLEIILISIIFLLNYFNINLFDSNYYNQLLIPITFLLFFSTISIINSEIIRAKQHAFTYFFYVGLQPIVLFVLGVIFTVYLQEKELGLIYAYVLTQIFYSVALLIRFSKFFIGGVFSLKEIKAVVKYGGPFIFSSVIFTFYTYSLTWNLQAAYDYTNVAYYRVGYSITNIVGLFNIAIVSVLASITFRYYDSGHHELLSNFLNRTIKVIIWLFIAMGIVIYGFADFLILLISQESYIESKIILIPLITVLIIQTARQFMTNGIFLKNKTIYSAIAVFIASLTSIILGFLIIPYFGILGVALTQIFFEIMRLIIEFPIAQYFYSNGFQLVKLTGLAIVGAIFLLSAILVDSMLTSSFIVITFLALTYLGLCLILKFVTISDIQYTYQLVLSVIKQFKVPRIR